ncbi:flagellar hook protein FlgE [Clostridium acidisoli DSM 12555]|uniref:Flagellar hook protein FlgE n=1 Tax=Clostridium acidisoli DSM 12555 TaxID=1121291 RepID=A0A1W1X257_9CLOT|nr:flagellar hook-basal body complex protein [Clostridium acidisoli]SMC17850.1 flagellar hook protein FlgE [Clostridium acidisoli DSM 12555]
MLQSMYSGISGMKASNQELDVISNNIANSQTTAFKGSSVTFEDMYNETIKESSSPTGNFGGTNISQVGTGTKIEAVNKDMGSGSTLTTNRGLDTAISGTGFFILGSGPSTTSVPVDNTTTHEATVTPGVSLNYSRDGSFSLDSNNDLVNSGGYKVMGYAVKNATGTSIQADGKTVNFVDGNKAVTAVDTALVPLIIPSTVMEGGAPEKVSSYAIDKNGVITVTLADKNVAAIGQIALASFNNDAGLDAAGSNMFSESTNSGIATLKTGINTASTNDNSGAYGDILSGTLEQSNVDLATEFTHMIEASRSFQANGKIISTGDEILQTIIGLKQ